MVASGRPFLLFWWCRRIRQAAVKMTGVFCANRHLSAENGNSAQTFFVILLGKTLKNVYVLTFSQVDNEKYPDYTSYNPP